MTNHNELFAQSLSHGVCVSVTYTNFYFSLLMKLCAAGTECSVTGRRMQLPRC